MQYLSFYPGDPTTPGYPAYEDAERVEAANVPRIPSLPIGWADAQRLLEEIGEGEGKVLTGAVSERTIRLANHGESGCFPLIQDT